MEVTELYELTKWVKEKVTPDDDDNLLDKYGKFIDAMRNSQGGHHPFDVQREALEDALEGISFSSLTREQKNFLEKVNVLQALGHPAIDNIEAILTRNNLDIATAINRIEEINNNLNTGVEKLKTIQEGLVDYISDERGEIEHRSGILTRISFVEKASIHNVRHLRDAADDWHIIGVGLAEICSVKLQDIRIVGASRGSIIFDLEVSLKVAATLGVLITFILQSTEKLYEIKNLRLQAQGTKLDNEIKSIVLEKLKENEEGEEEKIVQQTVERAISELDLERNKTANLKKAIERLFKFLNNDGHIDFIAPPTEDIEEDEYSEKLPEQEALASFRDQAQETRSLQDKVKRLRHKPSDNDNPKDEASDDEQEQE